MTSWQLDAGIESMSPLYSADEWYSCFVHFRVTGDVPENSLRQMWFDDLILMQLFGPTQFEQSSFFTLALVSSVGPAYTRALSNLLGDAFVANFIGEYGTLNIEAMAALYEHGGALSDEAQQLLNEAFHMLAG